MYKLYSITDKGPIPFSKIFVESDSNVQIWPWISHILNWLHSEVILPMLVRKVWHQERHNIIVCQWQMSPRCCRHYHFVANFFKGNLEITSYISSYNKLLARITFDSTDEGKIYIYESLSTLAVGASIFSYISHWHSASIFLSCWTHLKLGSLFIYYTFEPFCTGYHKIKHFACERDIFVREIPRLKHISSRSISLKSFEYPRLKHFSIHPNSRKMLQTQV